MNKAQLETVWAPRLLSILRIVAALIFMAHGTQKLLGFPDLSQSGAGRLQPAVDCGCAWNLSAERSWSRDCSFVRWPSFSRADGGRLLDRSCSSELLPGAERRRCGRSSTASCSSSLRQPAAARGAWIARCAAPSDRQKKQMWRGVSKPLTPLYSGFVPDPAQTLVLRVRHGVCGPQDRHRAGSA